MQTKYVSEKVVQVDKIYAVKNNLGGQNICCKRELRWTKHILKSSFGRQNYKK